MNLQNVLILSQFFIFYLPCAVSRQENALRQHLFKNYSSYVRPLREQGEYMNVSFNMRLIRLLLVEERNEKLATQAYYALRWYNEFLTWRPKEWDGIRTLEVDPKVIWIPDIILKNNADSNPVTIQKGTDRVWIKYTGECSWYPKVMMISSFHADVTDFPFDHQKFIFHFGSWSLGRNKLRIVLNKKSMLDRYYLVSAEWELTKMSKEIVITPYDSDSYSEAMFIYYFSRKPTYSVVTSIVPSFMLMIIALSSFILPPYNGERIKVLITALLAFTVFQVNINGALPRNSDHIPIIQTFYMVTMGECILCFLSTCLLARVYEKNKNEHLPFDVPSWLKRHILRMKEKQCLVKALKQNCPNGVPLPCKYEIFAMENQTQQLNGTIKKKTSAILNNNHCRPEIYHSVNVCPNDVTSDVTNGDVDVDSEKATLVKSNEMTWGVFVDYLDRASLRFFTLLFLSTSTGILLPAYLRKFQPVDS